MSEMSTQVIYFVVNFVVSAFYASLSNELSKKRNENFLYGMRKKLMCGDKIIVVE